MNQTKQRKATEACDWCKNLEDEVRKDPVKGVGLAFGAGILVALLPCGRLLGLALQVVLFALKPILIIFGALKLWEEIEARRNAQS